MLCENLILTNKMTFKDLFYLEMVSHGAVNDKIQTTSKEIVFGNKDLIKSKNVVSNIFI